MARALELDDPSNPGHSMITFFWFVVFWSFFAGFLVDFFGFSLTSLSKREISLRKFPQRTKTFPSKKVIKEETRDQKFHERLSDLTVALKRNHCVSVIVMNHTHTTVFWVLELFISE